MGVQFIPVFICATFLGSTLQVSQGFPTESESNWPTHQFRRLSGTDGFADGQASHPDLTQIVFRRPELLGADHNVRQEPPPFPTDDDLQAPRRRRSAETTDDDSDMYLEPDEEPQKAESSESNPSQVIARYEYGSDNLGRPQNFYPSFAPVFPLGHSRPPQLYHPIGAESEFYKPSRPTHFLRSSSEFNPFRVFREAFQLPIEPEEEASASTNLLGSGNFGVIRGGTYYSDEDRNGYYNNGHGRPYYNNPLPDKAGDFFANFRDFADINPKGSFSEYVIVYMNKNSTSPHPSGPTKPKNIIEQLSLIDQEKISQHKRKLEVLRKQQEEKAKRVFRKKDATKDEPLLALS